MSHVVTFHSYRGGTGKSTTAANIALLAAASGQRVAVVDTDIQAPGIHMFFGYDDLSSCRSLADYLVGTCEISDAMGNVSMDDIDGELYLVPARSRINEINEILTRGYDVGLLREGFDRLIDSFDLDALLLDTRSGMGNETVGAVAICTSLLVITRADHLISEARENISLTSRLGYPRTAVVVNMVPEGAAGEMVRQHAERTYESPVIAMLPYCHEVAALGSEGLFARVQPEHKIVSEYQRVAATVLGLDPR